MTAGTERWWEGASLYQVYVRSWQDTDGDGYGDLAGVVRRLGHLQWLGVDGLWLTPTMPSPDQDWGYDVSDYTSVHPELGSLEDLDRLVGEAGRLGLKVLLDLVPNHTSDAHPWFVESRSAGRDSPMRDWYVWADPRPDGSPPNNWLDATGASAWTLDQASGQYYLHNFLPGQPDLNWWNPEVRNAFEDILRFWFDRGVAGFRIDVAHALYHDRELRDNPSAPEGPETRFGQARTYSMNRPEVHEVYRSWRKLVEGYDPVRLLLGETWVLDAERLAAFYGDDDELHLGFNFSLVFSDFTAAALSRVVRDSISALPPGACPAWAGSNHDISRFQTRWAGGDPDRARLGLAVLCTLPGTLVLYAGDELGLTDVEVPPDQQRDPMTWRAADNRFNRDRARTPMPWDEDEPNYGFCPDGVEPWLPLGDRRGRSVAAQLADPGSDLWFARHLLRLRRECVSGGGYQQLASGPDQWVYRSGGLVVAANFSGSASEVDLPAGAMSRSGRPAGTGAPEGAADDHRGGAVVLQPWEAIIIQTAGSPDSPRSKEY
ncbi:MAG TPA: alpha-amylase family glycosyl hydrolase [Acidimicrobiales bacterium]|nr:alpha-amylase family glycosyl hydrolase [Acidimicrobiales bacterium]